VSLLSTDPANSHFLWNLPFFELLDPPANKASSTSFPDFWLPDCLADCDFWHLYSSKMRDISTSKHSMQKFEQMQKLPGEGVGY